MGDNATPSAAVDFLAGTAGGIASLLVGQPFDTIKTRLQAQATPQFSLQAGHATPVAASTSTTPLLNAAAVAPRSGAAAPVPSYGASIISVAPTRYYRSATDALQIIVREEKFFGLFKGVTSPLLGVAAMNACIFGSYGLVLRYQGGSEAGGGATLGQIFLAGCASGVISSLLTTPIELIKIREQLDCSTKGAKPQTLTIIKQLWAKRRLAGLYRGLGATCLRDLGYGPYFLCYEVFNRMLLSLHDATPYPSSQPPQLSNLELACSGALAGVLAWVSTFPIDCIKTRVQASNRIDGEAGWSLGRGSVVAATKEIWREGGVRAFWRGVGATVMRAIPVNASLFVVYEATKEALTKRGF
ncbi:mitochondrial carrier [Microstroma glucosiphilum]|uniref:Mitochondrial carrier n=1 Tax=Pseudomicrostroma glucosiphilum TaxID=1684307 RepID=A0A316UES8_9BASI|nr:mitochondrial carrier [Pseudomicrostroma glucosiphilum]PWN23807.1 mitochondrial carrier [Pseudomicrostroma glucosiphilum]